MYHYPIHFVWLNVLEGVAPCDSSRQELPLLLEFSVNRRELRRH